MAKAFVVYFSPAGTTRHVARTIETALSAGETPVVYDLGKQVDYSPVLSQIQAEQDSICLYIGSPVYAGHAVPQVMDFISQLPEKKSAASVPFITWGAVTSGIALYEMAEALNAKGYSVRGAAKIVAVHSFMLEDPEPLGKGHPDAADDALINDLVMSVEKRLVAAPATVLPMSSLAYQPQEVHKGMEQLSLEAVKPQLPQLTLDRDRCTQCGICAEECPAAAITCSPYPEFGQRCVVCYTCVRVCPEKAIPTDISPMADFVKGKAKEMGEKPETKIFL